MAEDQNGCNKANCSNCSHKGTCSIKKEELNSHSNIKHVIGVISGKGGVGKSTVTTLLARKLNSQGFKVGIMDGDITGPSIPNMFGINGDATGEENNLNPVISKEGIKVISMNLFLEDNETPVIYRGPVIASFIKQFWSGVNWGKLDYLLIDMPPGTGDVPLTVYQSIPIDGVIMVTSPQSLVKMIVMKAVNMAAKMDIPILGIVENYSYFKCPDCNKKHYIFGKSGIDEIAKELNTKVLAKLPIMPEIATASDMGEDFDFDDMNMETILNLR